MSKLALVTGSAGFIGRHAVRALQQRGYTVTQVDTLLSGDFNQRLRDARRFFDLDRERYDVVVHAAAHVGGRRDIEKLKTFIGAYNLQLDGALFHWALLTRPRHVVYLSSSAVYPVMYQDKPGGVLLNEDLINHSSPERPDETYGWVKLTGERLALEYQGEGGHIHVLRPFSGYGTDQKVDYPFAAFLQRVLYREDPFQIWGNGNQVRDWVHVDDVIGALLAVIDHDITEPMNVCTGRGVSMVELAELFIAIANLHRVAQYLPEIKLLLDAPVGVQHRVGDPKKLHQIYVPKISLEEGINRALRYHIERSTVAVR